MRVAGSTATASGQLPTGMVRVTVPEKATAKGRMCSHVRHLNVYEPGRRDLETQGIANQRQVIDPLKGLDEGGASGDGRSQGVERELWVGLMDGEPGA